MNSIPLYRDFAVTGALTHRPGRAPAPPRRGLLRRLIDAIEHSRQRAAEREIARITGVSLGAEGRLTDEMERRLFQHLNGNGGFRP